MTLSSVEPTTPDMARYHQITSLSRSPPTKFLGDEGGGPTYRWFITEDEYLRLCDIFGGRDFQETNVGATNVIGVPAPCKTGSYNTLGARRRSDKSVIVRVWTALQRKVHTADYMFEALKHRRMPKENMHDVYCSRCGTLTQCRSRDGAEGSAPHITHAASLRNADRKPAGVPQDSSSNQGSLPVSFPRMLCVKLGLTSYGIQAPRWGRWWLDENGSTKSWRDELKSQPSSIQGD
ncbi:hypothetical protein PLEOSDRAFT_1084146 [Pleurotus ostreatus PC15]|uniref:Uncharacterized protein n=1 Tax=Pleurotus ostreatus (strain PC15) TaxID=1137138 RepID=A0A067NKF8_PLEO1|nr:hypothetical protein PLEOSDRAFT_1084146 [Pleurotus ostreatus PC15]